MFLHPIDLEEAPDYYEVVSQPMDVETIRAKNDSREYEDLDAFRKDVALVLDNAKAYNSHSTEQVSHRCRDCLCVIDLTRAVWNGTGRGDYRAGARVRRLRRGQDPGRPCGGLCQAVRGAAQARRWPRAARR